MDAPANDRDRVLQRINEMIDCLTVSVSPQERNEGWTKEAKSGMAGFWKRLYHNIATDHLTSVDLTTPPSRGLSLWGVEQGELLTKGSAIFKEIVRLVAEDRLPLDQ